MTAQSDVPPVITVDVPMDAKKAEERLAHYHPEHHHFYEPTKMHTGKRVLRIVIAGTGFMADSYDLFVINIGKSPPRGSICLGSKLFRGCKSGGRDSHGPLPVRLTLFFPFLPWQ